MHTLFHNIGGCNKKEEKSERTIKMVLFKINLVQKLFYYTFYILYIYREIEG